MPLPNPSFQPKTHRWPRGGGSKFGGALPKLRILCPKTAFFGPKRPQNSVKTGKRRETVCTLHVRLDCPVTKSPFLPSRSTICPRNGPKMLLVSKRPKTTNGPYLGLRGHLVHPQPPRFCGFQASESPNETPRPPYQWSLGAARGQPSRRIVGANGASTGVPGAKKRFFSKLFLDHLGCSNKCF